MGRDAALGAGAGAVGAGTAAHDQHRSGQRDNYAPETGRSFPLGGSSNTMTGSSHPTGQTGSYPSSGSTTAGPHSSNLANKADPRVDSDLDGSRTTPTTGYGSGTGATAGSTHQGFLGRDATFGAGTEAAAGRTTGYGPESWKHEHGTQGHQFGGDPCGPGETTAEGPHFIPGPHATDTANRLDPHVAGGVGGTTETTAPHHQGHHDRHPEGSALTGGATGAGIGAYESSRDYPGRTTGSSTATGLGSSATDDGSSSTGPAPSTAGPHNSDMLNKLDPRVDSDLSKQHAGSGATGSGLPSSTTRSSDPNASHGTNHHRGDGAALGGAGLAGAATHKGEKHHRQNEPNLPSTLSGTSSSADPYSSSAVDPRVGHARSDLHDPTTAGSGRDHHLGRDAGLGAGAGGLAYEAERHHGQPTQPSNIPSGTAPSDYNSAQKLSGHDRAGNRLAGSSQQPAASNDHHYGRDAALGAGVGGAAYEVEKHHGRDHSGLASTPQGQLAGSGHQYEALHPNPDRPHQSGHGHHAGRDAAIGGAALGTGAGAAGVHEHNQYRDPSRTDQGTTVQGHQQPGDSLAAQALPGQGRERGLQDPAHHGHRKEEEEALAGGAAAGGLGHHERSKEEKALEKEHAKEVKQHEKALAKEKALEKDQKAHEKERAKHMAAIERDQKKHEHEHEHDKHKHKHDHEHEHDGEKKKGGLLGFLHRDKPDKELKEGEAARKASENAAHRPGDEHLPTGAASDEYADPLAGEHGSQSGVHDTPIGHGTTTHQAYGTHEGQNKLHKDPPGKVLEARGADYQGHGNVS